MWQTIDTAPTDGTEILGWSQSGYGVMHAVVRGIKSRVIWYGLSESAYATDYEGCWEEMYPTHWMPLPEPPV